MKKYKKQKTEQVHTLTFILTYAWEILTLSCKKQFSRVNSGVDRKPSPFSIEKHRPFACTAQVNVSAGTSKPASLGCWSRFYLLNGEYSSNIRTRQHFSAAGFHL